MLVVGLTGGIATGKSTVSQRLKDLHVPLVDADVLARQAVEPGTPALAQIVREFGEGVLLPDGSLDRKKLGSIIFNDGSKRRTLNAIVHPAVRRAMLWSVVKCWLKGEKYCVLDVPLLIESKLDQYVGLVVVVCCRRDMQLSRLMQRDGSTREDALSRLNAQMSIEQKVAYADVLIDNSGSLEDVDDKVDALVTHLDRLSGWHWRLYWLVPPLGLIVAVATVARRILRPNKFRR
ncbi:CoaE-domain-containing protein [Fistulina hepatica ATCC 64428]|uniref:CoaE-domain-containing protein n=1 Tax=Fistulina hepatica ATCC 64428 TaxID=1128425 RepID=A0A0D7AB80_9AGAR|nr:CoaE-domain-containing protein [Fistulina hepatica ATCC 64428]